MLGKYGVNESLSICAEDQVCTLNMKELIINAKTGEKGDGYEV